MAGSRQASAQTTDAAARLIPGVLGDQQSAETDSFGDSLLDYPHYTRPPVFRGMEVPEVLRSGDHRAIQAWRRAQSLLNTYAKRPDLLERAALTPEDRQVLNQFSRGGDA